MAVLWRSLLGLQAWSCRARTISGWWQCYCGFSFPEAFSPLIMHWTYFPRSFKLAVGICLFVPLLVSLLGSLKPLPWGRRLLRWRQTLNPNPEPTHHCAFWDRGMRNWEAGREYFTPSFFTAHPHPPTWTWRSWRKSLAPCLPLVPLFTLPLLVSPLQRCQYDVTGLA